MYRSSNTTVLEERDGDHGSERATAGDERASRHRRLQPAVDLGALHAQLRDGGELSGGFPFVDATAYRVGIVVFWPLLTALGLWGYRLYEAGETWRPRLLLAVYSLLGLTTLGHFFGGNPDIPPFFYATLFTDFLAGAALLVFVAWTFSGNRR